MRYRLAVLLVSLLVLPSCAGETSIQERVRVDDVAYRELAGGARILTGRVTNLTDTDIPVLQLQVSLFDERNYRNGTMPVVIHNIPADSFRTFREPVRSDADIRSARVRTVLIP